MEDYSFSKDYENSSSSSDEENTTETEENSPSTSQEDIDQRFPDNVIPPS